MQPPLRSDVIPEFLAGGGEMGERIRSYDWAATSLGPVHTWPQSLRTCVRIMLTSRQPMWIGWGKELIKLYNDPYLAIVRGKHPWALGAAASRVWSDVWSEIGPMLKKVMDEDEGTYVESQLLIMERNGYPEETYYTFSYTPIPGDNGRTAGMICVNTDDTQRIIGNRQMKTLTELGIHLTDCSSSKEVIHQTIACLDNNRHDITFALFYSITDRSARLVHNTPLGEAQATIPDNIDLTSGNKLPKLMSEASASRKLQVLDQPEVELGPLPAGVWKKPSPQVVLLPIVQTGFHEPCCVIILGLNPHRLFDEKYRSFLHLIADQVANSFAVVHAMEEERKRAAALAEIDRAKTTFFSNISHEFRTPLTLLMGPIQDALNDPNISIAQQQRMELAHRNALRMQKLVNTLLEFSRIEAGRVEGRYMQVDIGRLTAGLAGLFRSAIEKAGMQLEVLIHPIAEPVYVDVDMWERIILNLVSNAFKYSESGKIVVEVKQQENEVQVSVTDEGIGIDPEEQEKIFDRFYRTEQSAGRSQEGTGIGLAMVKELVRLHHGNIQVYSERGKGSTFTVSIPTGKAHLDAGKIVAPSNNYTPTNSAAFIEEAHKWLDTGDDAIEPDAAAVDIDQQGHLITRPKILLADDNADMREYVHRLLADQFQVITALDGEDAYQKVVTHQPDLVISDVMMPRLDGLALAKKLRSQPSTRHIPVILLSARAGEEARIEGMQSGADDYLVKPFSAKEVVAKVKAHISMAESRRQTEMLLHNFFMQAPAAIAIMQPPSFTYTMVNPQYQHLFGYTEEQMIGHRFEDVCDPDTVRKFTPYLTRAYVTGEPVITAEFPCPVTHEGKPYLGYYDIVIHPVRGLHGAVTDLLLYAYEVTAKVNARKKIEESAGKLEVAVRQRTKELQRSNDDLLQFAHIASHDLKEPVRKIKIFGQRLQDDFFDLLPEKGQTYLSKLLTSAERITTVIDGILSYSAVNATDHPYELIDLNDIIRDIETDLELLIQQKGARIETDVLPVIEGIPILIHQLFYNIVQNALKFTADAEAPVIAISSSIITGDNGAPAVHILIRDNGIGFDDQYAGRIFETFARLHPTSKFEGTGLGLALCKKIVERHGGAISASSSRNDGAEFSIILPVNRPNP